MGKKSANTEITISDSNGNKDGSLKVKKRTRKSVPRNSPMQRSSAYRGVTRHRWTGRYEAHLWDKNCWNETQSRKGRQVYLGAYDDEKTAARAYDLAALKYWGQETPLNFPIETYQEELKEMEGQSREEYIGSLRRKSSGFSRGVSKYRGVARHHHNGRWEARIGRVFGNKYLYLGTYATQEEAATAYDKAAIEHRGLNAVTNFDLSRYIKWIRPSPSNSNPTNSPLLTQKLDNVDNDIIYDAHVSTVVASPQLDVDSSVTTSSAVGLLLQSSKRKEMMERTSGDFYDETSTPPGSSSSGDQPSRSSSRRCSFPDDIQTFFECHDSGDELIFSELDSLPSTIFPFEFGS